MRRAVTTQFPCTQAQVTNKHEDAEQGSRKTSFPAPFFAAMREQLCLTQAHGPPHQGGLEDAALRAMVFRAAPNMNPNVANAFCQTSYKGLLCKRFWKFTAIFKTSQKMGFARTLNRTSPPWLCWPCNRLAHVLQYYPCAGFGSALPAELLRFLQLQGEISGPKKRRTA